MLHPHFHLKKSILLLCMALNVLSARIYFMPLYSRMHSGRVPYLCGARVALMQLQLQRSLFRKILFRLHHLHHPLHVPNLAWKHGGAMRPGMKLLPIHLKSLFAIFQLWEDAPSIDAKNTDTMKLKWNQIVFILNSAFAHPNLLKNYGRLRMVAEMTPIHGKSFPPMHRTVYLNRL